MKRLLGLFFIGLLCWAQTALTNESVIKMVKAGLGEEVVVSMISSQPGSYTLTPDALIELKKDGITDKMMAAMLKKMENAPAVVPAPAAPPAPANPLAPPAGTPLTAGTAPAAAPAVMTDAPVNQVGVYYKLDGKWTEMEPEIVNWKTGGTLKKIGSVGIVKGDVNGHVNGPTGRTILRGPQEFLVYVPEGIGITEYQVIHLRASKDTREFRTVTGGVFHASGGATRDLMPFEGKKIANRTYLISLPSLAAGEYGILPPGGSGSSVNSNQGRIYSFRIQ